MSEAESAPSLLPVGVRPTNCFAPSELLALLKAWQTGHPTHGYLAHTTVAMGGWNERMRSEGVAYHISATKIHRRGLNSRHLLSDFPQQICLCVSFRSLRRECFSWSVPYCPGRRHCGRTKQRCLSFQIPPQRSLRGKGGGLKRYGACSRYPASSEELCCAVSRLHQALRTCARTCFVSSCVQQWKYEASGPI